MPETKAIQRLQERMATLQPGSFRHEVLEAAKRFKNSWIDLGRMLWTVQRDKKFREWGYLTFDAYCVKEVGIRSATAQKLLHSYRFLENEEPAVLERLTSQTPPAQMPSPESVQLLRRLRNQPELPVHDYQRVRSYVLEEGREVPEVRKEIKAILKAGQPDSEAVEIARAKSAARRMMGTLKSLRNQLSGSDLVPKKLLDEIGGLIKKLEGIL